jgi:hypothetical protein
MTPTEIKTTGEFASPASALGDLDRKIGKKRPRTVSSPLYFLDLLWSFSSRIEQLLCWEEFSTNEEAVAITASSKQILCSRLSFFNGAVIKYLYRKGSSPQEISQVLSESVPSRQAVKNWSRNFKLDKSTS